MEKCEEINDMLPKGLVVLVLIMFSYIISDELVSKSNEYNIERFLKEKEFILGEQIILRGYFYRISGLYLFEDQEAAKRANILEEAVMLADTTKGAVITYSTCNNNQVRIEGLVKFDKRFDVYYISNIKKITKLSGDVCYSE